MTNPALFDSTQKTPEKIPSRAASFFRKKKYVFTNFKAIIK